jgi:hypothetical protein
MYSTFILKSDLTVFGKPERTWEYIINVGLETHESCGCGLVQEMASK